MAGFLEIPESDAGPELQVVYADIKATADVAMVNLIYRHMATIPDALPWAWGTIKSAIGYQQINAAAQHLPVTGFGRPLPAAAFNLLGLLDTDVRTAARIVDAYNRANGQNLVALTALRRIVDQVGHGPAVDVTLMTSPRPPYRHEPKSPLPPIVPMSAIDHDTVAVLRRLSSLGNIGPDDNHIIPSLYRHLAHWPAYLAFALAVLEPLAASGAIETARKRAVATAADAAQPLVEAALARGTAPVPATARVELRAALDVFLEHVIPKMLPIGYTLLAHTPEELDRAA